MIRAIMNLNALIKEDLNGIDQIPTCMQAIVRWDQSASLDLAAPNLLQLEYAPRAGASGYGSTS